MRVFALVYFFVSCLWLQAQWQTADIRLFSDKSCKALSLSVLSGSYTMGSEQKKQINFQEKDIVYISFFNDKVFVRNAEKNLGFFDSLYFYPQETNARIKLHLIADDKISRVYEGAFTIMPYFDQLLIINYISLSSYLAGVLEAECGTEKEEEYYMAHAIISRTYLFKNINRHLGEPYHLCDAVHCQVYKGRHSDENIFTAVQRTGDSVIMGPDTVLIDATFHSNCGGQTMNSQDVWVKAHPYLVSVNDPWCRTASNANWTKRIPLDKWKAYLISAGIDETELSTANMTFIQNSRKKYYVVGKKQILLKNIRDDWNLKSTFFSVEIQGKDVLFKGRGYGHGVGLCQQGAQEMAKNGKNYEEIIHFYFKNVQIISATRLLQIKTSGLTPNEPVTP